MGHPSDDVVGRLHREEVAAALGAFTAIDVEAARAASGVLAVVTARGVAITSVSVSVLKNGVDLGIRTWQGEETFGDWGWRVPFLISILLLAISVYIRLQLNESPVFKKMKAEGKGSSQPLTVTSLDPPSRPTNGGAFTLTINGNGATAVTGAPTALAANAFFRLRFDRATSSWYRVG